MMPPFPTKWGYAGKATRDALNPDGREMRRHEQRGRDAIGDALIVYFDMTWGGLTDQTAPLAETRATSLDVLQPLQDAITSWLQSVAEAGAEFAKGVVERRFLGVKAHALGHAPMEIDWELANNAAAQWAIEYGRTLTGQLAQTTTARIQREIARFITSGETLEDLIDRVQGGYMYSRSRAEAIAVTETTRAYARGSLESYKAAGAIAGKRWNTAMDEIVCIYCNSVNGQEVALDSQFTSTVMGSIDSPPAHTRCRCWVTPVPVMP